MNKTTKIAFIIIGTFILMVCLIMLVSSKINREANGKLLYSTTYYFGFGSRNVKIYVNGDVYDDLELEDPNHKPNYKYLKTLTKNELNNLTYKLESEKNSEAIEDYIIELVYGVKEFDNFGNY